jgi:hypothetical protein
MAAKNRKATLIRSFQGVRLSDQAISEWPRECKLTMANLSQQFPERAKAIEPIPGNCPTGGRRSPGNERLPTVMLGVIGTTDTTSPI